MFVSFQNNLAEARQMLLQNPQLSYALLQAMVVMRIIDVPTACVSMLQELHVTASILLKNSLV